MQQNYHQYKHKCNIQQQKLWAKILIASIIHQQVGNKLEVYTQKLYSRNHSQCKRNAIKCQKHKNYINNVHLHIQMHNLLYMYNKVSIELLLEVKHKHACTINKIYQN